METPLQAPNRIGSNGPLGGQSLSKKPEISTQEISWNTSSVGARPRQAPPSTSPVMSTPFSHHNDRKDMDATHSDAVDSERTDHEKMTSASRANTDGLRTLTKEEVCSIMENGRCFTDCIIPTDMNWEDINSVYMGGSDERPLKWQNVHAQTLIWNDKEIGYFKIKDSSFDEIHIAGSKIDGLLIKNSNITKAINMNGVDSLAYFLGECGETVTLTIMNSTTDNLMLENAEIPFTQLYDNKIENLTLRNTDLTGSNLRNTHVNKCDMENANLSFFNLRRDKFGTNMSGFKALQCRLFNASFQDAKMDCDTEIYLSDEFLDEVVNHSDQLEGFLESVATIDWDEYQYIAWPYETLEMKQSASNNHVKISLLDQLSKKIMAMPKEDRQRFIDNNGTAIIKKLYQEPTDEGRPDFYLNPTGENNSHILTFHNFLREHHSDKL
ncbi:MAG: hypothetical protein C5B47_05555 [Verrucomicrobia bacterium]|nr:MAG: hypothetical protein C5B47_05555 [Verrucomicrobiota bacterium]